MKITYIVIALALTATVGCGKEKKKGGEPAAKTAETPPASSGDNTAAKVGLDTGGKALGGDSVKLKALKFGGSGFDGVFNEALDSWTFEKIEDLPDGDRDGIVTIYVDAWDSEEWPADLEGFATKLGEKDFLDAGYSWPKIDSKTAFEGGWVITGETSDGDETRVSFAVQLTKDKLLCRGTVKANAKDVKASMSDAIEACKGATIP